MSRKEARSRGSEEGAGNSEVGSPKSEKVKSEISISEIKEPQTDNSKLQTEQMEVHHHPNLNHKEKPWKEYLLEYLMIFLAVTTGFFAESFREHLSERSKEKEYAISIKKDLVADTVNLNIWFPALYKRIAGFDTLITYLETPGQIKDGSNMYYLARVATRNSIFEPTDNTIIEMKSSGNLRLIRNREIVNDLMNYERSIGQYVNLLDIEGKENVLSYPLLGQLFDASIFNKMVVIQNKGLTEKEYAGGSLNNMLKPPGNPQLLSHNKEKINLLIYYLHQRKSSFMGEMRRLTVQREQVEKLIELINKEYNLEDE
ncbi:MAG TPA: hypothetical protein VGN20_12325 [Mucilaginibacter sp.]|jgi:hypothetical protein